MYAMIFILSYLSIFLSLFSYVNFSFLQQLLHS